MSKGPGLDVKRMNLQLNARGYKIVPINEDNVDAVVEQRLLFPKIGERPEMKLQLVKRPRGSNEEKFCMGVVRAYLMLDPDINMTKSKTDNDNGPVLRVIDKVLVELPEFRMFEKYGYWPLHSLILKALRGSTQKDKGYTAEYRARKKKEQEAAKALGTPTGLSAESHKTGAQETRKEASSPAGTPGKEDNRRIDEGVSEGEGENPNTGAGIDEGANANKDRISNEASKDADIEPRDAGGLDQDTDADTNSGMEASFRALDPASGLEATDQGDEELMEEFSIMKLDSIQDDQHEEVGGPILLQAQSPTPASRSRSNPFCATPPPRRSLVRPRPISRPLDSPLFAMNTTATATLGPQKLSNSPPPELEGVTPELIAQLSLLPAATLATFPSYIQVAVAAAKASIATSDSPTLPPTASAFNRALTQAVADAPTNSAPSGKAPTASAHIGELFDDDQYASDAPSASESNPPIDLAQEGPSTQKSTKPIPVKPVEKKTRSKVAAGMEGESTLQTHTKQAPVKANGGKRGKKGVGVDVDEPVHEHSKRPTRTSTRARNVPARR
ncbi:hypothetical protein RSOLAG22IIIB_12957 [Rhizoctonia solani]|uniref:Uncharacterized protein n=1 Tax=Rhizoctonia solani TaxID=456999 RepID=A0A0K6GHA2_9AGAM|nr:hypothetical protein RSOLAG22IIIB_12957 [Rhizoctonia solani]